MRLVVALCCALSPAMAEEGAEAKKSATAVYHHDAERTGWVNGEHALTPAKVKAGFGLLAHATLDDQVDAEPLVVDGVVYVGTEHNTVYAIDAHSGAILHHRNLGAPVPKPLGCGNNGPWVGINGTPAIDIHSQTLYVMAYVIPTPSATPEYRLHALDPGTLADKHPPVKVTASHKLTNGTLYQFNAQVQRQRPGLLLSHGNVYAAFGSFCDFQPEKSRGWLLGWNASTLAPLAHNELTDDLSASPPFKKHPSYFLSSVWMSGYGPAADAAGNVYFVTGNGNPPTWNGTTSLQETVAKVSPDLDKLLDYFTPSDHSALDDKDKDYGSGGVMLLPDQPGPIAHLAVAAGKDGRLFILDRDHMGKEHAPDHPAFVEVGQCWCGPSYYKGADGVGRVVTSGGDKVMTWLVDTRKRPALTLEATSQALAPSSQDGGFFTTVSSSETKADTQIIWAIGRPPGKKDPKHPHRITLYAFDATAQSGNLALLWSGAAGTWPSLGGNANLVPTVANGKVYVASYKKLAIFGTTPPAKALDERALVEPPEPEPPIAGALFWGTVAELADETLTIKLRDGKTLTIDVKEARAAGTAYDAHPGDHVVAHGTLDERGTLKARLLYRAKKPETWGEDKPH